MSKRREQDFRASNTNDPNGDIIESKLSKTYISPPERFKKRTIRDDLRVKYSGPDIDKHGKKGKTINLDGNMFRIQVNPKSKLSIHMYNVTLEPDIRFPPARIRLVNQANFGDPSFYNGNVMFLTYKDENAIIRVVEKPNGDKVEITLKYKTLVQPNSNDLNTMLGSFVKRCISDMDLVQINKGLYLMESQQPIDNYDWDVISGYKTTVLPHENNLMLTVNLSNKVMAQKSVLYTMNQLMSRMGPSGRDALLRDLVGKVIITRYNNKTYRIDDIDFDQNALSKFDVNQKDGTKRSVSFMEYYEQHYNIRIQNPTQPLLISRNKRQSSSHESKNVKSDFSISQQIALLPELCYLTGIPDDLISDFRFKKAMQSKIKSDARSRRFALDNFIQSFKRTKAHIAFTKWGFILEENPVAIPGRILDPYVIEYGAGEKSSTNQNMDFRGKRLYDASQPINHWELIYPQGADRESQEFINILHKVGHGLGMKLAKARTFSYRGDRDPRGLANILNQIKSLSTKSDIIVLMLKTPNKDLYDYFKKDTCITMGVPSQVLLLKHFRNPKGLMSIITKIAIQMQCKVGGAPWAIRFPPKEIFMVIGMDTYHDSNQRGLSCCAAVASLNNSFTKYTWATAMVQSSQEINTHMRSLFQSLLQTFIETHNGLKPTKIIIFRDGVGEGQVSMIVEYEFSAIQQCIAEVSPGAKLACLTLSKRIETRFFDRGRNPQPGTVVDQVCTHAGQKDFYLVPLESRQGTVTPIHYRLHYNTFNLGADNFQYLAYLLCHMYYNWTGPIKVPGVCQLAHKIAYLVGTSLHARPHQDLKTKLFFL